MKHRLFILLAGLSLLLCIAATQLSDRGIHVSLHLPFPDSYVWPIEQRGFVGGVVYWFYEWQGRRPVLDLGVARWWVIWATGMLPAWWLLDRLESRMKARFVTRWSGYCLKCGSDLRATPHRCPECGVTQPKSELVSAEPIPHQRLP